MRRFATYNLIVLLLLVALLPGRPAVAATSVMTNVTEADRQVVLSRQKYLFWQQINSARSNPRAVVARLGLAEEQVRATLGAGAWILDRGLAPLAWNDNLNRAASAHGRDMINNIYYSHTGLNGSGPAERVAATGYQALIEDETLGALVFSNYVDYDLAVSVLVDTMLRDELTGVAGVSRNIFSPALTEVGISFFAETLPLVAGQPYVYLLVADFATPLLPVSYLVGSVDTGSQLALQNLQTGFWDFLPLLPGDGFQVALPEGGARLISFNGQNQVVRQLAFVDNGSTTNRSANLTAAGDSQ